MTKTQAELGQTFAALHQRDGAFIIPNPWDVGTAPMLVGLGFQALATTSAGLAFTQGVPDNRVSPHHVLAHCRALTAGVDVPVSADLGNCFGDDPSVVAETMRLAIGTGLAGASVEDMKDDGSIYDIGLATERVRAAADVAHAAPFPFTLTARAENYLAGRRDLADTIARLQAFEAAGADVLYAPGITSREEIAAVVAAVHRPVNVIAGIGGFTLTFGELQTLGVKRISIGSTLARAAITAFAQAAKEMRDQGTFTYASGALSTDAITALFELPA